MRVPHTDDLNILLKSAPNSLWRFTTFSSDFIKFSAFKILSMHGPYHSFKTSHIFFYFFLAFHFCRFSVVIRFFHPRHNGQWPPTSKDFYPRFYPLHCFVPTYFFRKSQYFPFSMLSAKQGNYWYHFYNVFGMTRSLTGDWTRDLPHSKPAL